MILKIKKSQSTLEYIIILLIVIGAIIGAGTILKPNLTAAYKTIYH